MTTMRRLSAFQRLLSRMAEKKWETRSSTSFVPREKNANSKIGFNFSEF